MTEEEKRRHWAMFAAAAMRSHVAIQAAGVIARQQQHVDGHGYEHVQSEFAASDADAMLAAMVKRFSGEAP